MRTDSTIKCCFYPRSPANEGATANSFPRGQVVLFLSALPRERGSDGIAQPGRAGTKGS
jgi:hypothetical protein